MPGRRELIRLGAGAVAGYGASALVGGCHGDSSTSASPSQAPTAIPAALACGAARLNARYSGKVRLVCLDVETPAWVDVPTGTSLGHVAVSSLVTDVDRVISIPVAKTHKWAYLTLSLKNFIGITPLERYGWVSSGNYDRVLLHRNDSSPLGFGRLFVDLAHAAQPDLALIDFSIGMEGDGPSTSTGGTPLDVATRLGSWLVLASTDAVAADATAARIMGQESPYVGEILRMAHEAGMGAICTESIELVGARLDELRLDWRRAQVATAPPSPRAA